MCAILQLVSAPSIVNSRYWNRKELWGSNFSSNLLLLALTLHNIETAGWFIMMLRPYSNKLCWRVITHMTILTVPFGFSIDY